MWKIRDSIRYSHAMMKFLLRASIPILIFGLGLLAWKWLSIPVEPPKPQAQERQKLKSEKIILNRTNYRIIVESQGTIRAQQQTTITPLVSGTIMKIHPTFEDGAFFQEGEVLLELDPADLETEVLASESRLARAEAALIQEQARAKQAKLNWQDIGYDEEPSPLVMRIPQLREAEANVSAAKADLEQSRRNLQRTQVRAPFHGRVKQRLVGLGQAVGATTQLGTIFATATAEIRIPLSPSQISFIQLPAQEGDAPVDVTLTNALADPSQPAEHQWKAKIIRTEGTLDANSRELFAIALIEDPFSLHSNLPELRIGQPMRAAISGNTLEDVFVIPRSAMRGLNHVFLIDKNQPKIIRKDIRPVWSNAQVLVVRNDLSPGDWLAVSALPYTPNGAPVEVIQPASQEHAGSPAERKTPGES